MTAAVPAASEGAAGGAATGGVALDAAGGTVGGAARWRAELDGYLARTGADGVTVLGRGEALTPRWLVRRELLARGARVAVAPNNASFAVSGGQRRVLLRNALHFLRPSEEHLLDGMPRSFRAQISVVRGSLRRADLVVVPSTAMAERVAARVPGVAGRLAVRPHPVTPVGGRQPADPPYLLAPVVPSPYKNLLPALVDLTAALDRTGRALRVVVTAPASALPDRLARHPCVEPVGVVGHGSMARMWRGATAAFYPSIVEAFGYPLAEARVYGVPVLAPDTAQAREIAGPALVPYDPERPDSLAEALARGHEPVPAAPDAFDRDAYFDWLCATDHRALSYKERHGKRP